MTILGIELPSDQVEALIAVIVAGLLAAIPGIDRERRQRPAGLRTHMLVAMTSAMVTAMARITFSADSAARLVANIVTGIGFLGGGIIMQRKGFTHDVTTAATVWMVALLGIVVGYEMYVLAVGSTLVMGFVLTVIRRFEDKEVFHPAERIARGLDGDDKHESH
ncbi:MAG: MgtC/SapB family protein [Chloroflexi bacterium]|nr:MgtC/SapB family protein [Chloroflexota bacterium]